MPRQYWTREQDLAVLYLKLEFKKQLTRAHPAVGTLAKAMDRTQDSIWMRKGNFDSCDPAITGTGRKGLPKAAKLTRDIWAEYEADPDKVLSDARLAYVRLIGQEE